MNEKLALGPELARYEWRLKLLSWIGRRLGIAFTVGGFPYGADQQQERWETG